MLSFEWRELEALCDRLSMLRHRYIEAQRVKHAGLMDGLKTEIAKARRQRDLLVHHISARLAVVAPRHHGEPAQDPAGRDDHETPGDSSARPKLREHEPLL